MSFSGSFNLASHGLFFCLFVLAASDLSCGTEDLLLRNAGLVAP